MSLATAGFRGRDPVDDTRLRSVSHNGVHTKRGALGLDGECLFESFGAG